MFHHSNEDVVMAVHRGDFACLSDDVCETTMDSISERLGSENFDAKSLVRLNSVFRVETDQARKYLETEPGLRHAPLIIKESGCHLRLKGDATRGSETWPATMLGHNVRSFSSFGLIES